MSTATALPEHVARLEAMFETILATRMADVPILHPGLRIEAIGFEPVPAAGDDAVGGRDAAPAPPAAVGVLVTPWFMNLVRLPLGTPHDCAAVGETRERRVGRSAFPFIGAHEPPVGAFEACSLFSPMHEFEDHAAAAAVARAVLEQLRAPTEAGGRDAAVGAGVRSGEGSRGRPAAVAARRRFLVGGPRDGGVR